MKRLIRFLLAPWRAYRRRRAWRKIAGRGDTLYRKLDQSVGEMVREFDPDD